MYCKHLAKAARHHRKSILDEKRQRMSMQRFTPYIISNTRELGGQHQQSVGVTSETTRQIGISMLPSN
jgi:hypothetical protein